MTLAIVLAGLLSAAFQDKLLLGASVALSSALFYDLLRTRKAMGNLDDLVRASPGRIEEELTAGETTSAEVDVENSSGLPVALESSLDDGKIAFGGSVKGGRTLELMFFPELAGVYRSEGLTAKVTGSMGFWTDKGVLPLDQEFRVRPRVLAAAMAAARFLEAAGGPGSGDQPTDTRGAGLDFADSREYQPGDEIRHLDWKATARLNRPIVKEFFLEGGMGIHLVHEVGAPDPVSFDKLSTSFINTALALAQRAIPFGLTVFEEERVHLHVSRVEARTGLALALQQSLKTSEASVEDLYRILEPVTSRNVRRIVGALDSEPMRNILGAALSSEGEPGPYRTLKDAVRKSDARLHLVFNSSIAGDIRPLLELEDFARMKSCELMVLQPTTPWRQGEGLEDAYEVKNRYARIHGVLKNRGIPVSGSVESLIEGIGSESLAVKRRV